MMVGPSGGSAVSAIGWGTSGGGGGGGCGVTAAAVGVGCASPVGEAVAVEADCPGGCDGASDDGGGTP